MRNYLAVDASTWVAGSAAGSGFGFGALSLAGWWFTLVSVPIFQFLLLRWYFRLFIWIRFLWQVSRIDLQLVPTHPDRAGGLGFLANVVYAFAPFLLAHGILLAALIADRIFFEGAKLPQFTVEIISAVAVLVFVVLCPLLVFAGQLSRAKRAGLREYGVFAQRYVREFDTKWIRGAATGRTTHGHWRHPVARRPGQQLRSDPDHAARAVLERNGLSVGGRHARPGGATDADDDPARRAAETFAHSRVLSKRRVSARNGAVALRSCGRTRPVYVEERAMIDSHFVRPVRTSPARPWAFCSSSR